MNNPFYYQPDERCVAAAKAVMRDVESRSEEWRKEVACGKMFGVLVVEKCGNGDAGECGVCRKLEGEWGGLCYLAAYSGQILGRSDWEGYVPAVFDYLQEDGYFKTEEANIVAINREIARLGQSEELADARRLLSETQRKGEEEVEAYRAMMQRTKADADQTSEEYIRQRQFQKAELRRIKGRVASRDDEAKAAVEAIEGRISALKRERKQRSDALQRWLFSRFVMVNGRGERRDLAAIFEADAPNTGALGASRFGGRSAFEEGDAPKTGALGASRFRERSALEGGGALEPGASAVLPPAGAGECCAPKLLQYAFLHGLRPVAIAEFWVGESPKGEVRQAGNYYGACQSKCAPILKFMLQGVDVEENALQSEETVTALDVLFEDDSMIVVDKPAGMLSVPGKSSRRSAYDIIRAMRPECEQIMMAHRLDMQTSGVLVAAKDIDTYRELQRAFNGHDGIQKTYYALLDGILDWEPGATGTINLPLAADYLNRPRQKVDYENGKESATTYEILGTQTVEINGERRECTAIRLHPLTGRTHQLRLHCAHPDGLGMPILGDDLYGRHADRLYLHASRLEYGRMTFESETPFLTDLYQK